MTKQTVSLYVDSNDVEALEDVADDLDVSKSAAFRTVLREYQQRHYCTRLVCDECGEVAYLTNPDDCPACGSREVTTDAV